MEKNVEVILANMRAEAIRCIQSNNPNMDRDGRLAWYYSYMGALDMAEMLGAITPKRLQECINEFEKDAHEIAHRRDKADEQ